MKLIGRGVNGRVYNIGKSKVLKVSKGVSKMEYSTLMKLRNLSIVPKVKSGSFKVVNRKKKVSSFIMNKLPNRAISLKKYHQMYKKPNSREKNLIQNAVNKIHNRGISHGDLHSGNILLTHTGSHINKLWIIDFGRSIKLPKGMNEKTAYSKLPRVYGYSPSYGKLYGRNNAPSRPNFSMI
jgi:RIO-like serine/threonine protein kinase